MDAQRLLKHVHIQNASKTFRKQRYEEKIVRCFSASPRVVTPSKQRDWKQVHQESLRFLKNDNLPRGKRTIQAKEHLIQLVNVPRFAEKGPIASQILLVALQDLDASNYYKKEQEREMRGKLWYLTLQAWLSTSGNQTIAWNEAEKLLWEMFDNAHEHDNRFYCRNVRHNVHNINGAFAAIVFRFCKAQGKKQDLSTQTKNQLEKIVSEMKQLWDDPKIRLVPDSVAVDAILYYLFKTRNAQEADHILQWVASNSHSNPSLKATSHGVNTVLSAHAKDGNVQRIREILDQQMLAEESNLPKPDTIGFNILLDAVVQKGGRDAGEKAEGILQWMEELGFYPDSFSYSTAISAWSKSGDPNAAERAEGILRHSIYLQRSGIRSDVAPSEVTFSAIIHAWSVSGRPDATEKCLGVLELMKSLHDEQALAKESLTIVFNSLLGALTKTVKENAGDKVLELVEHMEKLGIPKNPATQNAILTALMKSSPQKAIEYFEEVESRHRADAEDASLNVMAYNIVLNALSKTDRELAPVQAMELLQRMMENEGIEPTTVTYNTAMKILAKSQLKDSALRCEELLEEMQRSSSQESSRPSTVTFATCITAWGYTRSPDRFDRMNRLLHKMIDSYEEGNKDAKPSFIPFNAVLIACCCHSEDREAALACILKTMDLMRRTPGVKMHQTSYPLLFRAIALNTKNGERRDSLLLNEFERCVQDGLVTPEVIETIEQATSSLLTSLWPTEVTPFKDSIPDPWKRNVKLSYKI